MLLVVAILGWLVWQVWWGRSSQSWPTTQGRIESVAIRRSPGKNRSRKRVHVTYDYAVAGTSYQGSRIRYGYMGNVFSDTADDLLRTYPPESTVTVHHHPTSPSRSVLVPGVDRASLALNLVGVAVVFAIGVFFAN